MRRRQIFAQGVVAVPIIEPGDPGAFERLAGVPLPDGPPPRAYEPPKDHEQCPLCGRRKLGRPKK